MDWAKCAVVEIDPSRVSGVPILRGTRMPVDSILEIFLSGTCLQEIAEEYEIPQQAIEDLLRFALNHYMSLQARQSAIDSSSSRN